MSAENDRSDGPSRQEEALLRTFGLCQMSLTLLLFTGCASSFIDAGPNLIDGSNDSWEASPTGLIYRLAGDEHTMYAVSLNAGIWRRASGEQWKQLPASSPLATDLAVDPNDPRHLVSSDRNGAASESNAARFDLNLSGIWESFDRALMGSAPH